MRPGEGQKLAIADNRRPDIDRESVYDWVTPITSSGRQYVNKKLRPIVDSHTGLFDVGEFYKRMEGVEDMYKVFRNKAVLGAVESLWNRTQISPGYMVDSYGPDEIRSSVCDTASIILKHAIFQLKKLASAGKKVDSDKIRLSADLFIENLQCLYKSMAMGINEDACRDINTPIPGFSLEEDHFGLLETFWSLVENSDTWKIGIVPDNRRLTS